LRQLSKQPGTVSELRTPFRMSQPAISQHLKILREAELVRVKNMGRFRRYELEPKRLKPIFDWVQYFEKFWDLKLANLGEFLDSRKKVEPKGRNKYE